MTEIFPKEIRKRIEKVFILPYQENINVCLNCPSFRQPINNGGWGIWKDRISYVFVRERGSDYSFMTDAPLEIVLQESIRDAGITEEDGFCIIPLTICRPFEGQNDASQRESTECCEVNFMAMIKSIIHINKLANANPPKVLLLGANTFKFLFPNEFNKSDSLKKIKSKGPWAHPSFPDVSFKLSYDTNAQLENPAYLQVLKTDIQLIATSQEEKLKMSGNYKLIETYKDFQDLMAELNASESFAFDIETSGLRYVTMKKIVEKKERKTSKKIRETHWEKDIIIGISFSFKRKTGYYLPVYVKLKHFTEERENYLKDLTGEENPLRIDDKTTLNDFRSWFGEFENLVYNQLKATLENPKTEKTAQNGKFDCSFLEAFWGIKVVNFTWDTMLASHIINENGFNSLDWLSSYYPDLAEYKDKVYQRLTLEEQEEESYADIPMDIIYIYGSQDADLTFRLKEDQLKKIRKDAEYFRKNPERYCYIDREWYIREFYMPLSKAYQECEINGILFDQPFADKTIKEYQQIMEDMKKRIVAILKANEFGPYDKNPETYFNLNSPPQRKQCFFKDFGWPVQKESKKVKDERKYKRGDIIDADDASTDQDSLKRVLEKLYERDPVFHQAEISFIEYFLEYSKKNKMINTYLDGKKILSRMDPEGYIHYIMKLSGTVSGRLSSTPNVQNLPRRTFEIKSLTGRIIPASNIRGIFTAPEPYKVFSADLSQAELRIMADYAKDENMFTYIREGRDIHWRGTQIVFYNEELVEYNSKDHEKKRLRKLIKLCNFGGLYGGSDRKKVQSVNEKLELGEPKITMDIAQKHTNWFWSEFPDIQDYLSKMSIHILNKGWIDSILGRRRNLPDALEGNKKFIREEAVRQGLNAQIQGTASDIVQLAYIRIQQWLKDNNMKSKVLWTVHDEIDGYAHPDEIEILQEIIPKMMCEKIGRVSRIEVPLESEFTVYNTRWGD